MWDTMKAQIAASVAMGEQAELTEAQIQNFREAFQLFDPDGRAREEAARARAQGARARPGVVIGARRCGRVRRRVRATRLTAAAMARAQAMARSRRTSWAM